MNIYAISSEVEVIDNVEEWLPEIQAPSNYKDPVKIADYIESRKATLLEQAADAPLLSKPVRVILRPLSDVDNIIDLMTDRMVEEPAVILGVGARVQLVRLQVHLLRTTGRVDEQLFKVLTGQSRIRVYETTAALLGEKRPIADLCRIVGEPEFSEDSEDFDLKHALLLRKIFGLDT